MITLYVFHSSLKWIIHPKHGDMLFESYSYDDFARFFRYEMDHPSQACWHDAAFIWKQSSNVANPACPN